MERKGKIWFHHYITMEVDFLRIFEENSGDMVMKLDRA